MREQGIFAYMLCDKLGNACGFGPCSLLNKEGGKDDRQGDEVFGRVWAVSDNVSLDYISMTGLQDDDS